MLDVEVLEFVIIPLLHYSITQSLFNAFVAINPFKMETTEKWEPKIVAFLCNWCSYAGADLAGVSRLQYGTNIRIIRVPCSGRINPLVYFQSLPKRG